LLLISLTSNATDVLRLNGLDRVYFDHVVGPGEPLVARDPSRDGRPGIPGNVVPRFVVDLLPEVLPPANVGTKAMIRRQKQEDDDEGGIEVRDVSLPLTSRSGEVSLRQIVASGRSSEISPRIDQLWWALYDNGHRSDVWYFAMYPLPDRKTLSNYEIDSVMSSPNGGLELQVRGMMFRPQGAWWVTGKTFSFSLRDDSLLLFRVRNNFVFFHHYDIGGRLVPIDVTTETEMREHFETRTYDSVPDATLRRCGFRDPMDTDNWEFNWAKDDRVARCVTNDKRARTSYRKLEESSFVERGGTH
jgi:hypothetical protein